MPLTCIEPSHRVVKAKGLLNPCPRAYNLVHVFWEGCMKKTIMKRVGGVRKKT